MSDAKPVNAPEKKDADPKIAVTPVKRPDGSEQIPNFPIFITRH